MRTKSSPFPVHCIQANTVIGQFLVACLLFFTINAFANNRPIVIKQYSDGLAYANERDVSEAGQFNRNDGGVVKAYREELFTSMAMPMGVACWFVLPDGTGIQVYKPVESCLLRTTDTVAELYWFDSLRPIASEVQQFDGYAFVDVTTPGKRWFSILIHLRTYLVQYFATILAFAAFASRVGRWMVVKPNPKRRWLAVKWGVGITVLLMTICFFLILVMLIKSETLLPSACFVFLTVGFVLYRRISKFSKRNWLVSGK